MDDARDLQAGVRETILPGWGAGCDRRARRRRCWREELGGGVGGGGDMRRGRIGGRGDDRVGGEGSGVDGDIDDHPTDEPQCLADLAGQASLVGEPTGQLRGHRGAGDGILECAGEHPPCGEIGDGHLVRIESGDRRGDEHPDAMGADGVELRAGAGADPDAGGLEWFLLESGTLLDVVENGGPIDARHRTEDLRELVLESDFQRYGPGRGGGPDAPRRDRFMKPCSPRLRDRVGIDDRALVGPLA